MAKSLNQVTIMGGLTRNPEIKTTPTGIEVGNFSLALSRSRKDAKGEWIDEVDYVDVTVWAKLAEAAQNLQKGSRVLITGRISSRSWDDKESGKKRTKVEIIADTLTVMPYEGSMPSQERFSKDVVIEDIEDGPIDLSEIPF